MHTRKQIRQIANSIRQFGFRSPILIDDDNRTICGHARVQACALLGMTTIPALRISDLSEEQIRGLMIADNRLTDLSNWDDELLAQNLKILSDLDLDFDFETIGFDYGEIEQRILGLESTGTPDDEADDIPRMSDVPVVSQSGDLWHLGEHHVFCGDSMDASSYERLLGLRRATMIFTDPPYNLSARHIGQVCSKAHGQFEMASGEMSSDAFRAFLDTAMGHFCDYSESGSIHFVCMDWRHMLEILVAGKDRYSELRNVCVWVKDRPGMGAFYRSQHELVFVFKNGDAPHHNNFGLGQYGRTRSNVWSYPSIRSLGPEGGDPGGDVALQLHPTVKPVQLIQDAILDCSRRGDIVLDPFLGSGSTLIACEKAGRILFGMEIAPRYIDTAIRRWEEWTERSAVHAETRLTFSELAGQRREEVEDG